jgi:hypothetical protein
MAEPSAAWIERATTLMECQQRLIDEQQREIAVLRMQRDEARMIRSDLRAIADSQAELLRRVLGV